MPEPGSINLEIEDYEDAVEIGRGGFAVVYRARRVAFNQTVAVKVLPLSTPSSPNWKRYERELQVMGALAGHPNIVTVYEAGVTANGHPYFSMEYLPFGSIAAHLATAGPLDWRAVTQHGIKLASALARAHELHVLHRDVKPENVLMSSFGEPKLADFGVSHMEVEGIFETQSRVITASVAHASPEALSGERTTEQSDIYSLGSTLFAAISGNAPFVRESDESLVPLMARIGTAPVPDLRPRGIPNELCRVLERAMAKEPRLRHSSAEEAEDDLVHIAHLGTPLVSRPISNATSTVEVSAPDQVAPAFSEPPAPKALPERAARAKKKRRPVVIAGAIAATVMLVAGLGFTLGGFGGGAKVRKVYELSQQPTSIAVSSNALWVLDSTNAVRKVDLETDQLLDTIELQGANGISLGGSLDIDGNSVWIVRENQALYRLNAHTDKMLAIIAMTPIGFSSAADVSAKGNDVWVVGGQLSRIDAATNRKAQIGRDQVGDVVAVGSGSVWVSDEGGRNVLRIDPVTNQIVAEIEVARDISHGIDVRSMDIAFGHDAVWVSNVRTNTVVRIDPKTNRVIATIHVGNEPTSVVTTRDAVWVANFADGTVSRIDPHSNTVASTVKVGPQPTAMATDGDGVWVATRGDTAIWEINN